jgi:hypothetical protein
MTDSASFFEGVWGNLTKSKAVSTLKEHFSQFLNKDERGENTMKFMQKT